MSPLRAAAHFRDFTSRVIHVNSVLLFTAGVLFVLLIASNWVLLYHSRSLTRALQARQSDLYPTQGMRIARIAGLGLDGAPVEVDTSDGTRDSLVFLFSPTCQICTANWPFWDRLLSSNGIDRFRLVFVNIAAPLPPGFVSSYRLPESARVLALVDPQYLAAHKFSVSPALLRLDPGGTATNVWLGQSRPNTQEDIITTLGLHGR